MDDTTCTSTSAPLSPVATTSSTNPPTPESKKKKRAKDSENATKQRLFARTLHKLYAMVDSNSVRPNIKKAYQREIAGLEKELGYDEDNDEGLEKELGHDEGHLHDIDSDSFSE